MTITAGLVIEVRDDPKPQGSMKHIGGGRITPSNRRELETWREAVKASALRIHTGAPYDGPIGVEVTFTVRKAASAPKKRITWPTKRPDVDKLARGVLDALVAAGVMRDDSQVVELTARKVYPDEGVDSLPVPGAIIRVEQLVRGIEEGRE